MTHVPDAGRVPVSARRATLGLAAAASVIAGLTLLTRVVGFGRWFVFSATVGATCTGSAYQAANAIPNVLYEVVAGGALAASVVPLLAGPVAASRLADVDRTASALLTWAVVVLVPVAVVLALLSGPIASLLVRSGCVGERALAAGMLVVFAPQVVLYGVGVVLTGVLQAHRRFVAPAIAPLLSSLVVIASYVGFGLLADGRQATGWVPPPGTQLLLSLGTTLGVAVLSLPLLVPTLRAGVRLRPTLRMPDGVAARARSLALAGLAGLVAQQALVAVTLWLTGRYGGTGTITVYQYVQAVYLLPYAVLAVPLATAAFPQLSRSASDGDAHAYAGTLARTTGLVLLVAAAGAAVLAAAAPAVGGVFAATDAGRGSGPGATALAGISTTLTAYAPGLVGLALIAHLGRALFAAGRSRWAATATATGWSVAAVLSVVIVVAGADAGTDPRRTLLGLGVASSVGMTVAGAGLLAGASRVRVANGTATGTTPTGTTATGTTATGTTGSSPVAGAARTLAAAVAVGLAAAVAGRVVTDAVGTWSLGRSLLAGVAGSAVTGLVLAGGWSVTSRSELVALTGRLPRRRVAAGGE